MRLVEIKQYLTGRLVVICISAFFLAAILTAISDIFDVPTLVAKALSTSSEWMHPAVDAFFVLIVGAFATYLISRLVLERTKMEKELKLKAQLLDTATDSILLYRPDGSFVYVNEAAYKSRGYTREQLMAMNRRDFAAPECAGHFDSRLKEILDKRKGIFESVHLCKNGDRIPVEIHARAIEVGGEDLILSVCRDITERKQAEKALLESEERFRSIVENSHDGIMILDDAYRFIYVNDELCRISGYSREEAIGQDFPKFLDEESKQLVVDRYIRRQRGEEVPPRYEFNIVRKDGQKRRVEISSAVIKDSAGRVKTVAQILDITERKQAEEALRESQQFSSSLLESSPNPITVINLDTSIRYVNPAFEKLTGFTLAEIAGRKAPYSWWPEEQRKEITAALKDTMAHGGRRSERIFQKRNGERFWVALNSAPVVYKGKPIYFILNWLDITERKRMEEQLMMTERLASIGELASGIAHELNNPLTSVIGFSQLLMERNTLMISGRIWAWSIAKLSVLLA